MNESSQRRRLRFRFSLLTLFVVLTIVGSWLGWNLYRVRKREQILRYIVSRGGTVTYHDPDRPWRSLPATWSLFGAESVKSISLTPDTFDDVAHVRPWFPEADLLLLTKPRKAKP